MSIGEVIALLMLVITAIKLGRVVACSISLMATSLPCTHSAAPSFQIEPASLGFDLVFFMIDKK